MMKRIRAIEFGVLGILLLIAASPVFGQIVINEVVKEQRTAGGGVVEPDTREFIELYNAGATPVDLANWSIVGFDLTAGSDSYAYTIPADLAGGTSIAPGGYFVVGAAAVPGVKFTPLPSGEMFTDLAAQVLELRNNSSATVDAVGYEVWRASTTGLTLATPAQVAQIGSGYMGSVISPASNPILSWSRYRNGHDTNQNGLDFGFLPLTPGASNVTLPVNASHTIPNVDSPVLPVNTALSTQYYTSFVLPRVIDPTVSSAVNPRALPTRSPQGGNAIIAWDETGGGNAVYSKELVNKFDLYAYFDTTALGVAATTLDEEYEFQVYGIGSLDPLADLPDPSGLIPDDEVPGAPNLAGPTKSGATGIGWVYEQFEPDPDGVAGTAFSKLFLVDFGDSGDSTPNQPGGWDVIQEINLTDAQSGWHRLGVDYNPTTGAVVARFGDQTFNFTTDADTQGNFYVVYRECITGAPSVRFDKHNPPIYDLFVAGPVAVAGDYNSNGVVDAADYTVWRDRLGGTTLANDGGISPGVVDQADYNFWKSRFGATTGSGSLSSGAVPEPGMLALVSGLLALVGAGWRRQRA